MFKIKTLNPVSFKDPQILSLFERSYTSSELLPMIDYLSKVEKDALIQQKQIRNSRMSADQKRLLQQFGTFTNKADNCFRAKVTECANVGYVIFWKTTSSAGEFYLGTSIEYIQFIYAVKLDNNGNCIKDESEKIMEQLKCQAKERENDGLMNIGRACGIKV